MLAMPCCCSLLRFPRTPPRLALLACALLALAGCPQDKPAAPGASPAAPSTGNAGGAAAARPGGEIPLAHLSAELVGQDNGAAVSGTPAKELVRMVQQVQMNPSSIHRLQENEFPPEWPAGLRLPQNCYVDTDGAVVFNPLNGGWQGCLLLQAPHDKVVAFLQGQFAQFGTVTVDSGGGKAANLMVQPPGGSLAALSAMVAPSNFDASWSRVYLEFVPRPGAAGASAGSSSNGS
jgi:hypothetical protein